MAGAISSAEELPIVWLIDESPSELRTYRNSLRSALPDTVQVEGRAPFKSLQDYLPLLANPRTACVITDQRLKVSGVVSYTGIELAEFMRGINSKLPIYILTNYADDTDAFIGLEWSVEDIISKSELADADGQKTVAARIVRRLDTYEDILGRRSERMQALLGKSSQGTLSESELAELDMLGLQRSSPMLAEELSQLHQLDQLIREHGNLMRQFRAYLSSTEPTEETNGE